MTKRVSIAGREVGDGQPCFIVAEISCNHLQQKDTAMRLISEAKKAGADAVKFQIYGADAMTINSDKECFKIKGTAWNGMTFYKLYEEAATPKEWFPDLIEEAKRQGMIFFASVFDNDSADYLESLSVPAYKIASFEINHIPLLKHVAAKKKPMILSTGVAGYDDIRLALKTIYSQGNHDVLLLKCTSAYPAPLGEANLSMIADMRNRFKLNCGLSDHSISPVIPAVAVSLGAKMIEKHFTLEKKGHDAGFSLNPDEFSAMVKGIRDCETALGRVDYGIFGEAAEHKIFMRSIFVIKDIKKGEVFTKENIGVIRPNCGLAPLHYKKLLGKKAAEDISRGTPMEAKLW